VKVKVTMMGSLPGRASQEVCLILLKGKVLGGLGDLHAGLIMSTSF
jgi:hypothetical protein